MKYGYYRADNAMKQGDVEIAQCTTRIACYLDILGFIVWMITIIVVIAGNCVK